MVSYLETDSGRRIAYHQTGKGPGIVFLGGFMSDMQGSKATHLEQWCAAKSLPYVRFDYSGHGQSSGEFTDGAIGDWAADARAVIEQLTEGPQILVGSSMGGWISLLMAKQCPQKISGLVTIAAAPDFTEDGFWASFNEATRRVLVQDGVVKVPSDYGDPYPITHRLIEEGRQNLILRSSLILPFPVRFLQGDEDKDVSVDTALKLMNHASGPDMRLTILKGADHSFSDEKALRVIEEAIEDVLQRK
ncbi:MAG: alpha/beta hydrolase [Planktomarina sp.]